MPDLTDEQLKAFEDFETSKNDLIARTNQLWQNGPSLTESLPDTALGALKQRATQDGYATTENWDDIKDPFDDAWDFWESKVEEALQDMQAAYQVIKDI